jgi:glycine/D-amino acid oxidase-like deaminating enzyme
MTANADVVIIGGGIVGAACAYYLCREGLEVHLVERRFPASGTSRACDGLILLWDKMPGPELSLGQASSDLWEALAQEVELDFEYARKGTIFLAENEQGLAAGREKAKSLAAAGVRAEVLDNQAMRSLEPNLAPDVAGGVFFPDDAQVDARRATLAMLLAAQRLGLVVHTHCAVTDIRRINESKGQAMRVNGESVQIDTANIVCAAGVWSNRIAGMLGVKLPLRPRKGQILVTAKVPGLVHHPILEGGYVSTVQSALGDLQVALVAEPTDHGTVLLGSSREFAGFDRSVSLGVVQAIAARAVRFLPALTHVKIMRSYAGLRPWSPDHLPLIGPWFDLPGFYVAAGHEGAGIGLAPITGRLIADQITGREPPAVADAVRPDRFRETDGEQRQR